MAVRFSSLVRCFAITLPLALGACSHQPIHTGQHLNGKAMSQTRADNRTLQQVEDTEGTLIILPSDQLFEQASAKFKPAYLDTMKRVISIIKQHKNMKMVSIAGHTDNIGGSSGQQRLSRDQAETVAAYLWANGVPWTKLEIYGYADKYPIANNHSLVGSSKNRRIEIKLR